MTEHNQYRSGEAAKFLRVSPSTLARWRVKGTGPQYTKSGSKLIIYLKKDLIEFLEAGFRSSTSEDKEDEDDEDE